MVTGWIAPSALEESVRRNRCVLYAVALIPLHQQLFCLLERFIFEWHLCSEDRFPSGRPSLRRSTCRGRRRIALRVSSSMTACFPASVADGRPPRAVHAWSRRSLVTS
jgi:hypothetical protein